MSTEFTIRVDGERVAIRLFSLDEYETDGGTYDDSGNGGEDVSDQKADFLCAAVVPHNDTGLPENDVLELAGVERSDYWTDSVTGYFLLRDWPAEAPLQARMVESAS